MADLDFDNITYKLIMDDRYTTEGGMTYEYVSLKKVKTFKGKAKYSSITIKHEHWRQFRAWLLEELGVKEGQQSFDDMDEDPPEEKTDLEPF